MEKQLSKESLEDLYAYAFGYYDCGNYAKAVEIFRILTALSIDCRRYWKGFGASLQMNKNYPEAVEAYSYAALLDDKARDPEPHLYAAECLCSLNEMPRARLALKSAAHIAKKEKKHHYLLPRINALGRAWKEKEAKK